MRYFLIGYKTSGKTTLGKELAQHLKMKFIDLDEFIEQEQNSSIPEIYTSLGEEKFRTLEWKALKKIVEEDNVVVSTGGGAPCFCDNMNIMQTYGETIYLRIDEDILLERLKVAAKSRPIVMGKSEEELREYVSNLKKNCEHHYTQAKHIVSGRLLKVSDILNVI